MEKECSHTAFPVRNRPIKKQRKKDWPSDVNWSIANEKIILPGNRPRKCSLPVRASTLLLCVQGLMVSLSRAIECTEYANKLFTPQ